VAGLAAHADGQVAQLAVELLAGVAWVLLRHQDVEVDLLDLAADASQSVLQAALVVQAEIPRPDSPLPRLPDEPVVPAMRLSHVLRPDRIHARAGSRGPGRLPMAAAPAHDGRAAARRGGHRCATSSH